MRSISYLIIVSLLAGLPALTSTALAADEEPIINTLPEPVNLGSIRQEIYLTFEHWLDDGGPYGCYRRGVNQRSGLYASLDVALMRVIMGEDLQKTVSQEKRNEWINLINSYQDRKTGHYEDSLGHSKLHANGMVVGALGALGGKMRYPVKLYDAFDEVEEIGPWLDSEIKWSNTWGESHLFWGGLHCYSFSKACTDEWLDAVFKWLDENADPETGWWRKGVKHANSYEALGGFVHIVPIYEHHNRKFPYPEKVIDSVLAMQKPEGHWLESRHANYMTYMELDALYALAYMQKLVPEYRKDDIKEAVKRYSDLVRNTWPKRKVGLFYAHPHHMLASVGIFGLLQQHLPEVWVDDRQWTDIFSDRELYQMDKIEVLPEEKK